MEKTTHGKHYRQTTRPKRLRRGSRQRPPKQTIPPIRQRIRGPFSRYSAVNRPISATKPTVLTSPLVRQKIVSPVNRYPAVNERISRPTLNPISSIEAELAEIRRAWARYQSTNSRDAVYIYLASVFALVMRWRRLNCALKKSRAALRLQHDAPQMKPEPFGIVIFCTSDPERRRRQDPEQMVQGVAIRPKSKTCRTAPH